MGRASTKPAAMQSDDVAAQLEARDMTRFDHYVTKVKKCGSSLPTLWV